MTTERKIEIARAVMNNKRLGSVSICSLLLRITNFDNIDDMISMREDMYKLYLSFGGESNIDSHWFPLITTTRAKARTERINFLKKYIEHLKQQQ